MRNTAVHQIDKLAADDPRICLMTADLGYNVLTPFIEHYPDRYYNVGISEQAMNAMAAGMALEGEIVFTYSIGNFPTLRCLEQIRNDICYHNANVKIIALGGGFAYGQLGMSHHATEDIAALRALPNMHVFVPADPAETVAAVNAAYHTDGPCYIRLGRGGEKRLHDETEITDIERIQTLSAIGSVNILSAGAVAEEALEAARLLNARGMQIGAFSVPTIKQIDSEGVLKVAAASDCLLTLEEHNVVGGLGSAVADLLAEKGGIHAPLIKLGLQDVYPSVVGSQKFLRDYYGFSANKIVERILAWKGGAE